jgi:hypothetical protein
LRACLRVIINYLSHFLILLDGLREKLKSMRQAAGASELHPENDIEQEITDLNEDEDEKGEKEAEEKEKNNRE